MNPCDTPTSDASTSSARILTTACNAARSHFRVAHTVTLVAVDASLPKNVHADTDRDRSHSIPIYRGREGREQASQSVCPKSLDARQESRASDFVIELRLCGETASTEVQRVSMKETSPRVPTVGLNAQFPWASKLSL